MSNWKLSGLLIVCFLLISTPLTHASSIWDEFDEDEFDEAIDELVDEFADLNLSFDFGRDNDYYDYDDDGDWHNGRFFSTRPRRRHDRIEFKYEDDDYDRVYIAGSFNDWEPERMKLDDDEDFWVIKKRLNNGRHRYHFVVKVDEETWEAIDPSVEEAIKTKRHGWVSELNLKKNRVKWRKGRNWHYDEIVGWSGVEDGFCAAYNRVDGFYPTITTRYWPNHDFDPAIKATVGYGFKSKEWGGSISIVQPLTPENYLSFKASAYSQTDFTDQTGIRDDENSLAFALFKKDFRDYYRREGATLSLIGSDFKWWRVEAGVHFDDYLSMNQMANWSIWGDEVADNPEVDEGVMRTVFADMTLGYCYNNISIGYEHGGADIMKGDFEFEQIAAQYRARLPLGYQRRIDFRIKAGTTLNGSLPRQKRFFLGGLGTVRGYEYQSILSTKEIDGSPEVDLDDILSSGGEKMFLANVEYKMDWDHDFSLVFFADTGMVWFDQDQDVNVDDLKSSAGIGFIVGDAMRINLIKCLDGSEDDVVVQARICRMF